MNDRWVCKRCFADNESTDAACRSCGLTRGAEAGTVEQVQWAAAAAAETAPKPAGWTRWLRFWWIPALAVVLIVGYYFNARRDSSGAIEGAGTVAVTDVRAGDCFNMSDEVEISDVHGVPCDEPHQYQAYHVGEHASSTFPTDAEFDAIFERLCLGSFQAFVGTPYAESALYASMITPSESSFADGDRGYTCVLFDPAGDMTGTMQGSQR